MEKCGNSGSGGEAILQAARLEGKMIVANIPCVVVCNGLVWRLIFEAELASGEDLFRFSVGSDNI